MCCLIMQKQLIGAKACYWLVLQQNFDVETVRQFQAYDALNPDALRDILNDEACELSKRLEKKSESFFDPQNLFRYETEEEVTRQFKKAIRIPRLQIKGETLRRLVLLLKKCRETRLLGITAEYPKRAEGAEKQWRIAAHRNSGVGGKPISDFQFRQYLSALCGYPIWEVCVDHPTHPVTIFAVSRGFAFPVIDVKIVFQSLVSATVQVKERKPVLAV